jgi:methylated-DNA-[protein]-cysteine S-methyltransferase
MTGFVLFDTAIGCCGLVWGPRGIFGAHVPEPSAEAARARLLRRFPDAREAAPPPDVARAVDGIVALMAGAPRDLADIPVDLAGVPAFDADVYALARAIPPGATRSYGDLARDLGDVALSRAVGAALGRNPVPVIVPCHRVIGAKGGTGGFSARGGVDTKLRMLTIERARTRGEAMLFDDLPLAGRG